MGFQIAVCSISVSPGKSIFVFLPDIKLLFSWCSDEFFGLLPYKYF